MPEPRMSEINLEFNNALGVDGGWYGALKIVENEINLLKCLPDAELSTNEKGQLMLAAMRMYCTLRRLTRRHL